MTEYNRTVLETLQQRYGGQLYEYHGEVSLVLAAENLIAVCQNLRHEHAFELLVEETAVDYWPEQAPRFHVIYRLRSLKHNQIVGLRVPLDGNAPSMPSLTPVYANANWFERELFDMFGIHFENHPDLRRIMMPADWEGHPLRKDYPLGYEEVQFTFNFDEIYLRKPIAKE